MPHKHQLLTSTQRYFSESFLPYIVLYCCQFSLDNIMVTIKITSLLAISLSPWHPQPKRLATQHAKHTTTSTKFKSHISNYLWSPQWRPTAALLHWWSRQEFYTGALVSGRWIDTQLRYLRGEKEEILSYRWRAAGSHIGRRPHQLVTKSPEGRQCSYSAMLDP